MYPDKKSVIFQKQRNKSKWTHRDKTNRKSIIDVIVAKQNKYMLKDYIIGISEEVCELI